MKTVRKTCFEKLEDAKILVLNNFPTIDIRKECNLMSKLATYHYKKKKYIILGEERKLYNFLIENSLNPFTVYRWLLLERIPNEIRFQLKNHMLSQKKATSLYFQQRHETETSLQQKIRALGLELIRGM